MRKHEYITTRDACNHFDVSYATVYNWIQKGWLRAEKILPDASPSKRLVGRYHIDVDEFAYFDTLMSSSSLDLKRYVPRELHRKGLR